MDTRYNTTYSNVDIRGVKRGKCKDPDCECEEFTRLLNATTGACDYCGHYPIKHMVSLDVTSFPDQSSLEDFQQQSTCSSTSESLLNDTEDVPGVPEVMMWSPIKDEPLDITDEAEYIKSSADSVRLPNFSPDLKPLLEGCHMPEKEKIRLTRKMRDELINYLDSCNIAVGGNRTKIRWQYCQIGRAIHQCYPNMLWDQDPLQPFVSKDPWALFIKRVSSARKVRRFRKLRATGKVSTTSENESNVSKAMKELELLDTLGNDITFNVTHISKLLRITFEERTKKPPQTLPVYFLNQTMLTQEVERRFGKQMAVLTGMLCLALNKCNKYLKSETLEGLQYFLKDKASTSDFISYMPYSVEERSPGPRLFISEEGNVICASHQEIIYIDGPVEVLAIICLGVYFIKDLEFPVQYGQILRFLQKTILPDSTLSEPLTDELNDLLKCI